MCRFPKTHVANGQTENDGPTMPTRNRRRRVKRTQQVDTELADKVVRRQQRELVRAERRNRRHREIAAGLTLPSVAGYRVRYEPRRNGPSWANCLQQVIARGPQRSKTFAFRCPPECDEDTFRRLLQDAFARSAEWAPRICNGQNALCNGQNPLCNGVVMRCVTA